MARRTGLGKGIDSLIPETSKAIKSTNSTKNGGVSNNLKEKVEKPEEKVEKPVNTEMLVKIGKVEPNRDQPRKKFDEEALKELSDSIKQYGIITPLIVSDKGSYYEIIAGERRWRAARMAGLKEIPVVVREYNEEENAEVALIENLQREDLNSIEEAIAYQKLIDDFGMTHDVLAQKVSKSRAAITNSLRLLKLTEPVREMVEAGNLSGGHARALLGLNEPEKQEGVAARIISEGLSVRKTEELVKKINKSSDGSEPRKPEKSAEDEQTKIFFKKMEDDLIKRIGAKVNIKRKPEGKGKIEIEYSSLEELERIGDIIKRTRE